MKNFHASANIWRLIFLKNGVQSYENINVLKIF